MLTACEANRSSSRRASVPHGIEIPMLSSVPTMNTLPDTGTTMNSEQVMQMNEALATLGGELDALKANVQQARREALQFMAIVESIEQYIDRLRPQTR